MTNVY